MTLKIRPAVVTLSIGFSWSYYLASCIRTAVGRVVGSGGDERGSLSGRVVGRVVDWKEVHKVVLVALVLLKFMVKS